MNELHFTWDPRKALANERKHDVAFGEAKSVFSDEGALMVDDPDHSADEDRFIIIGFSSGARLLTVCHCYRESDEVIRIISARRATPNESTQYIHRNVL